jgi:predicted ferric reductase
MATSRFGSDRAIRVPSWSISPGAGLAAMSRIQWTFGGLVMLLAALWLATLPFSGLTMDVFALRPAFLQGTGTLAIGVMSVAMVLATRPMLFERWLGGLDKMYRLHKWLGITALCFACSHWLWIELPKALVGVGWLVRPARLAVVQPTHPVLKQLDALREPAQGLGEWALYALVALVGLALLKRFPYRRFFQTHRLLPVVYLMLVFHAVVLTQSSTWTQAIGLLMALFMLAGTVAAVMVLVGAVGRSRQAVAVVDTVSLHAALGVLLLSVRLKSRWAGHQAGQFAFVRFDAHEGAHPFTIISPWTNSGHLAFLIKGLGDYTTQLPGLLTPGDLLRVEGPYGQFTFKGQKQRQIWVGGGIGITPFIARLQQLALHPDGRTIDLFHTTTTRDEAAFARLRAAAIAARVRLHLMVDAVDGRLTAQRLCAAVPDWELADVWFCGPAGFGNSLRHDLLAKGLAASDFHQELFNLR